MAVSKRLRFEILRRDNHACRYCGAAAPEARLTIDHVVPVALGGADSPDNLVAACMDCNAGKSSSSADSAVVDDLRQDALRWASAMRAAVAERLEQIGQRDEYLDAFRAAWDRWTYNDKSTVDLPADWRRSLERWMGLGIPIEIIVDAINNTMQRPLDRGAEFRYFAGVVWSISSELRADVTARIEASPNGRAFSMEEAHLDGYMKAWDTVHSIYGAALHQWDALSAVVDKVAA